MPKRSIPTHEIIGFSFPAGLSAFPEHAALIADIIALWNLLEDRCVYLLEAFSGMDGEQADLMLSRLLSPAAKMDLVAAAGKWNFSMFPEELGNLEKFFKSVNDRLLKRNKYAHGVYMVNRNGHLGLLFRKFDQRKEKEKRFIPLHIHELKDEVAAYSRLLSQVAEIQESALRILPTDTVLALNQILLTRRALRPNRKE